MTMFLNFNMYPAKTLAGILAGLVAIFMENLLPLFVVIAIFEMVDFITGCVKSYVVAKRNGKKFTFESVKAWRTIYKFVFLLIGIFLCELLDMCIATDTRLRLANYFTGFACGVEFWSFLENAAVISDHPLFRWLRRFMKLRVSETAGLTIDDDTEKEDASKGSDKKK